MSSWPSLGTSCSKVFVHQPTRLSGRRAGQVYNHLVQAHQDCGQASIHCTPYKHCTTTMYQSMRISRTDQAGSTYTMSAFVPLPWQGMPWYRTGIGPAEHWPLMSHANNILFAVWALRVVHINVSQRVVSGPVPVCTSGSSLINCKLATEQDTIAQMLR